MSNHNAYRLIINNIPCLNLIIQYIEDPNNTAIEARRLNVTELKVIKSDNVTR